MTSSNNSTQRKEILLHEERYLLDLLAAFVCEQKASAPSKTLDDNLFLNVARSQLVSQVAAYMALQQPDLFTRALSASLIADLQRAVGVEARQTAEFSAVNKAFQESRVPYMPLKGFVMREYYPEPYLRLMGDYDVLVNQAALDRAVETLKAQGYQEQHDSSHHIVFWKGSEFCVELHYNLTDSAAVVYDDVSWETLVLNQGTEFRFTKEDFYRFMQEHLLKHWVVGEGTVRFFLDVAIYLRKFGAELDRTKLEREFERYGELGFVRNVERLQDVWFHGAPSDDVLDEMTLFTFRRHTLNEPQKKDRSTKYATQLALKSPDGQTSFSRLRYLLANVFPRSADNVIRRELEKTPAILKPIGYAALWLKFSVKRLLRKSFFTNVLSFLRVKKSDAVEARAFHRRIGLDLSKFNPNGLDSD